MLMEIDISIIVTTYNHGLYLKKCIDSCINQHCTSIRYEIIVVDDGSIDQTDEVLEQFKIPLLRKFKIANSGIEVASNFGISKAKGRYILRVDADDMLADNYISSTAQYIDQNYDFIYADYTVIDSGGRKIDQMKLPDFDPDEIRVRGDFLATGTMYKKEKILNFFGYNEGIKNSGLENYELVLKLLENGGRGMHIAKNLFFYRRHSNNISSHKIKEINANGKALFQRMNLGEYSYNQYHPYKNLQDK